MGKPGGKRRFYMDLWMTQINITLIKITGIKIIRIEITRIKLLGLGSLNYYYA